jgi:hypothetical protein
MAGPYGKKQIAASRPTYDSTEHILSGLVPVRLAIQHTVE